jgi:hypothetical protein
VQGDNPAPNYATFSFRNSAKTSVTGIHFIDCIFLNGASKDSTDMDKVSAINRPGPSEYFVDWTLTLRVADSHGRSVPGATVVISEALGRHAFKGTTDAAGTLTAVLTEFRRFNTTVGVTKEMRTPHNVTITHDGCAPNTVSLLMAETTEHKVELTCHEPQPEVVDFGSPLTTQVTRYQQYSYQAKYLGWLSYESRSHFFHRFINSCW